MNTRIQVESGISGGISRVPAPLNGTNGNDVDLIAEQIRLALGKPMACTQADIAFEGVCMEYRIVAEDPEDGFKPQGGNITNFSWKEHDWLKFYSHVPVGQPYSIPTDFDPNLALALIWGASAEEVKQRGKIFLQEFELEGLDENGKPLKSNVQYLLKKLIVFGSSRGVYGF